MANINAETKVNFNIPQLVTAVGLVVSMAGTYYSLNAKINAVEEETSKLKQNEQKYTWPAQRKLEEDVANMRLEFTTTMKDLEYSMRDLEDLKNELRELNK